MNKVNLLQLQMNILIVGNSVDFSLHISFFINVCKFWTSRNCQDPQETNST